jgi:hypothetical protein
MTFDKLHRDIKCDCLENSEIAENTVDMFARRVRYDPPRIKDFTSFLDRKHPVARPDDCHYLCMHRGVSITKVDASSEAELKKRWAEYVKFKPGTPRMYCKFRLKTGAGKVWPTPSREDTYHNTLLRSDQFHLKQIEVVEVVPL